MENRISVMINEEAQANILKAIAVISQNLPELVNLSASDRQMLPKMGDKSVAFVNKTLEYAKQNPAIVPTFLDMGEFEKDTIAAANIKKILNPFEQMIEKLGDTYLLAGSEAYMAALIFYNAVKGAAKAGVPGMKTIYDDLQSRFPGRGKGAVVPATQTN